MLYLDSMCKTGSGTQRINAPRSVATDFNTWYQNPQSSVYGSAYVFSQSFTVQVTPVQFVPLSLHSRTLWEVRPRQTPLWFEK
jgi:hypothetical protein